MREREVIKRIADRLRIEGAINLQVRYGHEHGPDIECMLPRFRRTLYLEAKGTTKNPMVDLGTALYQILSRYDGFSVCAIALPWTGAYEDLLRKAWTGLRTVNLHFLLIRGDEIWYLGPRQEGFFPSKVESLLQELEG